MTMFGSQWLASTGDASLGDAVFFDGTDVQYLSSYGASDQRANWLVSIWLRFSVGPHGSRQNIHYGDGSVFQIWRQDNGTFRIATYGPGGSGWRQDIYSNTTIGVPSGWTWIGICGDGTEAGNSMFFNNTDVTVNAAQSTSSEDITIGGYVGGEDGTNTDHWFVGDLFHFYLHLDGYLDLTTESNRRKFITADNKPVDLGADGSTPTGSVPNAYYRVAAEAATSTFANNLGSAGNASLTGTLTRSNTTPEGLGTGCTIDYTSNSSVAASATTTWAGNFDGMAIGAADSTRLVVAGISGSRAAGGDHLVSACTIGGETASLVVRQTTTNGEPAELWAATVPTGTTADVDITFDATMLRVGVGLWRLTNCATTATETASDYNGTPYAANLEIPAGGVGIGYFLNVQEASDGGSDGNRTTWTNLTKDFDADFVGNVAGAGTNHSGASAQAAEDLLRTAAPPSDRAYYGLVLAAFGPA